MIAIKKLLLLAPLLAMLPANLRAQSYSIPWSTIAGGGGTSSGGTFSLSGTAGQPDASGTLSGGSYTLSGGFWSMVSVVQSPNSPVLSVTHSGPTVVVSWPVSPGFVLQQNAKLWTTNWVNSTLAVTTNSTAESVTVPNAAGSLYFRLTGPTAP